MLDRCSEYSGECAEAVEENVPQCVRDDVLPVHSPCLRFKKFVRGEFERFPEDSCGKDDQSDDPRESSDRNIFPYRKCFHAGECQEHGDREMRDFIILEPDLVELVKSELADSSDEERNHHDDTHPHDDVSFLRRVGFQK